MKFHRTITLCLLSLWGSTPQAQTFHEYKDNVVFSNYQASINLHTNTGKIDYHFAGGITLENTVAYLRDINTGLLSTAGLDQHPYSTDGIQDSLVVDLRINIK